jgi:sporulation protein YlmC with PRC-barrel domain
MRVSDAVRVLRWTGLAFLLLMSRHAVGGENGLTSATPVEKSKARSPIDRLLEPTFIIEPDAGTFSVARMLGVRVRNFDGDVIGVVEDVLVAPGGYIRGVVIGYGGYFGMDRKRIAVPWSEIKTGSGGDSMVLLGIDQRHLDDAPAYAGGR